MPLVRLFSTDVPPGDSQIAANDAESVERGAFDAEAGGFESGDNIVDRFGVARLAFDLDHRVLGGQPGEDPAVVDLDDIDSGFEDFGGDCGERSGLIVG